MLQDFQFKIIHSIDSRHLNVDAFNMNLINLSKEDEDFGCNVMEQEDKLGDTSLPLDSDCTNEVVVNLFILYFINLEATDIKGQQMEGDTHEQSVDTMLEEKLHPMELKGYHSMVIKTQNMVD
jgi:hypothetical protein